MYRVQTEGQDIAISGLKSKEQFLHAIRKGGFANGHETINLRPLINKLRDEGKYVGVSWSAHKIHIFTANHKREIIATGTAVGIAAAIAGTIYFVKRSPRSRKEK